MRDESSRRGFLKGVAAAAALTAAGRINAAEAGPMKAIDVNKFFLSRMPSVDPKTSVDRIIIGEPEKVVRTCLVTWMSSLAAVKEAIKRKVDLLITHEPTFYDHWDKIDPDLGVSAQKRELIQRAGLVIIRNHDVWDRLPEVGIPWSWGRFLGLGEKPQRMALENMLHRYDITPTTLGELARKFAAKTATIGEPTLQVIGDESTPVSKIGVGTGCFCEVSTYVTMGCDCSVVCDDGTAYWRQIQMAEDMGHPVIRVHHGTSEEPGMVSMAKYINANLPGLQAEYLPHKPAYHPVTAV